MLSLWMLTWLLSQAPASEHFATARSLLSDARGSGSELVSKEALQMFWSEIQLGFAEGEVPSNADHQKISADLADLVTSGQGEDQWAYLRLIIDDYNKGTAPHKMLERNLGINPFGNTRACSLSDPNSGCTYAFANPGTQESSAGTCRGYVASLMFINNNFSFKKTATFKGQCPLPQQVCEDVFGSYEQLLFAPKGHFDQYFSWNPDSCTYELPCFGNLLDLSKNCFRPDRRQPIAAHSEALFQHLVSSFNRDELTGSKVQEKLKALGYDISDSIAKLPSDLSKAFVAKDWVTYRNSAIEHGFPARASIANQSSWHVDHAILLTGYDKAKDELSAIDPNFPGQIVQISPQKDNRNKITIHSLSATGKPRSSEVRLYGIHAQGGDKHEQFYYHSRFYALTQQKKCNGKIQF